MDSSVDLAGCLPILVQKMANTEVVSGKHFTQ